MSVCAVILSQFPPTLTLGISILINAGLSAAILDLLLSSNNSPKATEFDNTLFCGAFHGDDRHPTAIRLENIATWVAYYSPHAKIEGQSEQGDRALLAEIPKSWVVFLAYDNPTPVSQILVNHSAAGLPPYNIVVSTMKACAIAFSGDIPAGVLEIEIRSK